MREGGDGFESDIEEIIKGTGSSHRVFFTYHRNVKDRC